MKFTDSLIINCDVYKVWAVLNEHELYPQWHPSIVSVKGNFCVGEKVELSMMLGSIMVKPQVMITEVNPLNTLQWHGSMFKSEFFKRLFSVTRQFELKIISEDETYFSNQEQFSGILGNIVGFIMQYRLKPRYQQLSLAIKQRSEKLGSFPPLCRKNK